MGAAADSQRLESYKTSAHVTAAPIMQADHFTVKEGVSDHCKNQCLLDPYMSAAITDKGKITLFLLLCEVCTRAPHYNF